MTPRELLNTCRKEMLEIIILAERREALEAGLLPRAIRLTWDRIKTHPEDHVSEVMAKVADLDDEIVKKMAPMMERQLEAQRLIETLDESRKRQALTLYYLTMYEEKRGKFRKERLHTWDDVAEKLYYDTSYCRKLATDAIRELSEGSEG